VASLSLRDPPQQSWGGPPAQDVERDFIFAEVSAAQIGTSDGITMLFHREYMEYPKFHVEHFEESAPSVPQCREKSQAGKIVHVVRI